MFPVASGKETSQPGARLSNNFFLAPPSPQSNNIAKAKSAGYTPGWPNWRRTTGRDVCAAAVLLPSWDLGQSGFLSGGLS